MTLARVSKITAGAALGTALLIPVGSTAAFAHGGGDDHRGPGGVFGAQQRPGDDGAEHDEGDDHSNGLSSEGRAEIRAAFDAFHEAKEEAWSDYREDRADLREDFKDGTITRDEFVTQLRQLRADRRAAIAAAHATLKAALDAIRAEYGVGDHDDDDD